MGKYPIINLTLTDYPRMMLKFEMKGLNYTRSFFHTNHFWFIFLSHINTCQSTQCILFMDGRSYEILVGTKYIFKKSVSPTFFKRNPKAIQNCQKMVGLYPYRPKRFHHSYLLMFLNTDQTTYIDGSCRFQLQGPLKSWPQSKLDIYPKYSNH